jgi:hypothetical protein
MQFRKKPVVINAIQWDGTFESFNAIGELAQGQHVEPIGADALRIPTLEGDHRADKGDWIIRGVKGEIYPCKPDIFAATYDVVEQEA